MRDSAVSPLRASAERFALILTQPLRGLRRRINAWIMTRTRRQPGPISISRRRVYILPTRYGYAWAFMLLVMLLGAMNYSNSMAFALTFLLSGLGLIAMHHTHGNLIELQLLSLRARPVFAGDTAEFELEIENPSAKTRWTLSAAWNDDSADSHVDLPPGGRGTLHLRLPAPKRGWLPAPRFSVATEFPLGLFHAWTWAELDAQTLVYPKPAGTGLAPQAVGGGSGGTQGMQLGNDEFAGLRDYQRGDSAARIHWKSLARSSGSRQPLQAKQFNDSRQPALWFDWSRLPATWDTERRLSQLTRWVLDAEAARQRYGLRLPGSTLAPDAGEAHREACLRVLALYAVPIAGTAGL